MLAISSQEAQARFISLDSMQSKSYFCKKCNLSIYLIMSRTPINKTKAIKSQKP